MLKGYDIDGVITSGVVPDGVIISGRTFAEYDDTCKKLAQTNPLYIRGNGKFGDREHSGKFKALMIKMLGVNEFYEDDPVQLDLIQKCCPDCKLVKIN